MKNSNEKKMADNRSLGSKEVTLALQIFAIQVGAKFGISPKPSQNARSFQAAKAELEANLQRSGGRSVVVGLFFLVETKEFL